MKPLERFGRQLVIAVHPGSGLDEQLFILLDTARDRKIGSRQRTLLRTLRRANRGEGRFVRSVRNSFVLGGRGEDMRYFCSPNQKTVLRTRRIVELRSGPKNAKVAKEIPYSGVRSRR